MRKTIYGCDLLAFQKAEYIIITIYFRAIQILIKKNRITILDNLIILQVVVLYLFEQNVYAQP